MEVSIARRLFQTLIFRSIQRCRLSQTPCCLSVSLKISHDSNPPLTCVSISDTGVGSSLEEFLKLDIYTLAASSQQWDGILSITTTGVNDKEIQHLCLNIKESNSSNRGLIKLPSTYKTSGTFSGTKVSFSTCEGHSEEFVLWAIGYIKKILILKDPNIILELSLESINGPVSTLESPLHESDDTRALLSLSSIECMAFGLQEYSLKHGFTLNKECEICSSHRELLIEGTGVARNSEKNRIRDQLMVEAVILVMPLKLEPSCWPVNSTQVLCFQDHAPSSQLDSCLDILSSIDWPSFGLKLKEAFIETEGKIVIEWEDTAFAFLHIVIHCYHKTYTAIPARNIPMPDRNLIRKAIKAALEDLKASNTHIFLSSQAIKIQEYVPDLSRSIANLILSSNDSEFKQECTTLLGLSSLQSNPETLIETCISEKLARIIEANDMKSKAERGAVAPSLFECGSLIENQLIDEETGEADEDYVFGY